MEDRLRIYFSSRPRPDLSLTTFVDMDRQNPEHILHLNAEPILPLGEAGTFDQHGIMPAAVVPMGETVYLYYSGWSRGVGVPYSNYTGLAISEDGGRTFTKYSQGPIIDRTPEEIFSATSPAVIRDGDMWHMWYCCGTHWLEIDGRFEHTYEIRHATSHDGIVWERPGERSIPQQEPSEAITRASVLKDRDGYHMWFCYRGSRGFRNGPESYRIGYACSTDCRQWQRKGTKFALIGSDRGWDNAMTAYPDVVDVDGRRLMFYNGNSFGADGFGLAILE
jgi:hypothetical protein